MNNSKNEFEKFIVAIKREDLKTVERLFKEEYIDRRTKRVILGYRGRWTALHVASRYNKKGDVVKYLLDKGWNREAETRGVFGRWKCIHVAAEWSSVEVLKTLIDEGCNLDSVTERGENVVIREHYKECVEIIKRAKDKKDLDKSVMKQNDYEYLLKENSLLKIMNPQTGKTFLDELLNNKDANILEAIKSKPVNDQEIDEWRKMDLRTVDIKSYKLLHECMLVRCLYKRYEDGVLELCTTELANKKSLFMGPTALETAVECGVTVYSVRNILWKLIEENESWTRAEEIAKKKNQPKILSLISERREYLNEGKKSLSRLHVAVIENDPGTISYILDNDIIDADEGHKKSGTALSLSYSLRHKKCTEVFKKCKVNGNTVDKTYSSVDPQPIKECGDGNSSDSFSPNDESINNTENINIGATSIESDDNPLGLMSVPLND